MEAIRQVAVIGAGLMGHGIAQVFAVGGYPVTLVDISAEPLSRAVEMMRSNLTLMAEKELVPTDAVTAALERIKTTTDLEQAAATADFVVEAVLEKTELKQKIFRELDALCPEKTLLATNTSVISITEIASQATHRHRIVGTHFWNPPYLIPLVEVVRGADTSDATMETTFALLQAVGKHPVRVQKDVPGFVANRLQHALWREAISIVEHGIADAATVDECVRMGFGLRLPVLGPLENADMVGNDLTYAIHDYILKRLDNRPHPSPLLKAMVDRGELGFKTGQGFMPWPAEEIQASRSRLREHLFSVLKKKEERTPSGPST
jgi:3-hydroxybutyryl-CoA dehydrogenase